MTRQEATEGSMTNRRKIYVVESGEYSDYSVVCAFDREEDASLAVENGFGDSHREMILFAPGEQPKRTILAWEASAWARVPNPTEPHVYADSSDDSAEVDPQAQTAYSGRPAVKTREIPGRGVWINVRAADRETALKVCSDRYARHMAELEGL